MKRSMCGNFRTFKSISCEIYNERDKTECRLVYVISISIDIEESELPVRTNKCCAFYLFFIAFVVA